MTLSRSRSSGVSTSGCASRGRSSRAISRPGPRRRRTSGSSSSLRHRPVGQGEAAHGDRGLGERRLALGPERRPRDAGPAGARPPRRPPRSWRPWSCARPGEPARRHTAPRWSSSSAAGDDVGDRAAAAPDVLPPAMRRTTVTRALGEVAGADLDPDRDALELPVDGPAAERGVDPVVELDPHAGGARARRRSLPRRARHALAVLDDHARRLDRRQPRRHPQAVVVAVAHDQPADHAGRRCPTRSSSTAAAGPLGVEVADVEGLGEVLPELVAGAHLQGLAVAHHRLAACSVLMAPAKRSRAVLRPDHDRHRQHARP